MKKLTITIVFTLLHASAWSADLWDLRALAKSQNDSVALKQSDGNPYKNFSTKNARSVVDVANNLSLLSGIYPRLLFSNSPTVNAVAGRKDGEPYIVIHSGLFDIIKDDPAMMAALIGHEMAHLYYRHGQKQAEIDQHTRALASFLGTALEMVFIGRYGVIGLGRNLSNEVQEVVSNAYSRDYEREADKQGAIWAIQTGYDANSVPRLFLELEKANGNSLVPFLQSHPNPSDRFEATTRTSEDYKKRSAATVTSDPDLLSLIRKIDEAREKELPTSPEGQDGAQLFRSRRYAEAKEKFEGCAATGEIACLNNLGVLYQYGLGVRSDAREAARLYKSASDKGSGHGQVNYIGLILTGIDEEHDTAKVVEMTLEASQKGSPKAMGLFASGANAGQTLPKEYVATYMGLMPKQSIIANYAKAAALRGEKEGLSALGNAYAMGWGIPQNIELAEMYLTRAAAMNDTSAYAGLLNIYETMNPDANKANAIKARFASRPALDSALAGIRVWFYCSREPRSEHFSAKCFELATKFRPHPLGPVAYGYAVFHGLGTEKNPIEGTSWIAAYKAKQTKNVLANAMYESFTQSLGPSELQQVQKRSLEILANQSK
jgi:Zn-dependent protease with chaperone function